MGDTNRKQRARLATRNDEDDYNELTREDDGYREDIEQGQR